MIVNHRLLSSPMIVNQWHSEMMNQPLVPTLRPSAFAPALGVDSSSPRAIDFPIIGSFGAYDFHAVICDLGTTERDYIITIFDIVSQQR